jgi:hypothetical protein
MPYTQQVLLDMGPPADLRVLRTISWFLTVELHKQLRGYTRLGQHALDREIAATCRLLELDRRQTLVAYARYFHHRHRDLGPVILTGEHMGEWDFGPFDPETQSGLYWFTETAKTRTDSEIQGIPCLYIDDWTQNASSPAHDWVLTGFIVPFTPSTAT